MTKHTPTATGKEEEKDSNNRRNQREIERDDEEYASKAWGLLIFGFIGATITTFAYIISVSYSQISQLRRSGDWFYTQMTKSSLGRGGGSSGWGGFREEAWKRYKRRLQEQYDEEMERVERIRRMQNVFNRERDKYKRSYERWREYGPGAHEHVQRDDWYWSDATYRDQRTNQTTTPYSQSYSMSHHYTILGLDRSRAKPYTDAEVKTAFREKAMQYHPDQNKDNKEAAEAKFIEVMTSYEAIKQERKNNSY